MKYEEYVDLIRKLENLAGTNRKAYERKVFGLAAVGYGYLALIVLVLLAIPTGVIILTIYSPSTMLRVLWFAAKFWWAFIPAIVVVVGFVGSAAKSFLAKVPPPEGSAISESDASELFKFVRETTEALEAKFPEEIQITDEFNASVVTVPRIGIFGRKVYLRLGLPLMRALSPEQFKAVVAHEIGHISGKHGAFGKWAYQLHEVWGRFIDSQELEDQKLGFLYQRFVNWFFPRFQAYSFVLMREHEKEADDYAVELFGARPLGDSLIALHTRGSYIDDVFWRGVQEGNTKGEPMPEKVFSLMMNSLNFVDEAKDKDSVKKALAIPTDYNDSHPSLSDRLARIGYLKGDTVVDPPSMPDKNASEHFLSRVAERFVADFDRTWDEQVAGWWSTRQEHIKKADERFEELKLKNTEGELTAEEMIEQAGLVAEKEGNLASLPMLRAIVEKYPDHAEANYLLGGVMLSNEEEDGMEFIDRSMTLDPQWRYPASEVAFDFLRSKGRLEEAKAFASNMENEQEAFEKGQIERSEVTINDEFGPHTMPEDAVEEIKRKLQYYEEIQAIYLVQKVVNFRPDIPFHVLFLDVRKSGLLKHKDDLKPEELVNAIASRLSESEIGYFATLTGMFAPTKAKVDKIAGAKIFERGS